MATKKELYRLIRQNCSECMGGPRTCENVWPIPNIADVRGCTSVKCAFYRFRFGYDSEHEPDPQRQATARARFGHSFPTKQGEEKSTIDDHDRSNGRGGSMKVEATQNGRFNEPKKDRGRGLQADPHPPEKVPD